MALYPMLTGKSEVIRIHIQLAMKATRMGKSKPLDYCR